MQRKPCLKLTRHWNLVSSRAPLPVSYASWLHEASVNSVVKVLDAALRSRLPVRVFQAFSWQISMLRGWKPQQMIFIVNYPTWRWYVTTLMLEMRDPALIVCALQWKHLGGSITCWTMLELVETRFQLLSKIVLSWIKFSTLTLWVFGFARGSKSNKCWPRRNSTSREYDSGLYKHLPANKSTFSGVDAEIAEWSPTRPLFWDW